MVMKAMVIVVIVMLVTLHGQSCCFKSLFVDEHQNRLAGLA